jgi:proteic killer suppression protein
MKLKYSFHSCLDSLIFDLFVIFVFNGMRLTSPPSVFGRSGRAASWKFGIHHTLFHLSLGLDLHKQIVYIVFMISSFANKETEKLFTTGKSKKLHPEIITRSIMRLTQLDSACEVTDLLTPPSNRLETLSGDRAGQWSIRINDQWRICFRFLNGEASEVEITDYH